jgi:hypothetical protein
MHITRTDKGYRLECSETEWEIMELIVDCGMADLVDEEHRANLSLQPSESSEKIDLRRSSDL